MKRVLRSQSDFKTTTLRNQLTSLILYESIITTKQKAKQLIKYADHFFHDIARTDLTAKKIAHHSLFDTNAVKKAFEEIMPRFEKEATNFVRGLKTTPRRGDGAEMMMVIFNKPFKAEKQQLAEKKEVQKKLESVKPAKKSKKTKK